MTKNKKFVIIIKNEKEEKMKKILFVLFIFTFVAGCATKQATKEIIITKTQNGGIQYKYIYKGKGNIGTEDILNWANAVNIIKKTDAKKVNNNKQKGKKGKIIIVNVSYKTQNITINTGLSQKKVIVKKMKQKTLKIKSKGKIYIKNKKKQIILPAKNKKTVTIKNGKDKIIVIYLNQ